MFFFSILFLVSAKNGSEHCLGALCEYETVKEEIKVPINLAH